MKAHEMMTDELTNAGLHVDAALAIVAAMNARNWGVHMAQRFATRRGVPIRLVKLAMALERDTKDELWA
jgi:hypothetical protein